jgi:peptidyl-prolyl cis-trans isomerase D
MFESVRRNQRIFLGIVLLLIIPSFVVVGAWDLVAPGSNANTVAQVDGQKIQYAQWERSHQQNLDRIRQQLGGRIDPALFDSTPARLNSLEELVTQQVLLASAQDLGIRATDLQLRQTIAGIPQIQKNGQFDLPTYQQALKAQGLTAEQFEQQVRAELAMEILPRHLASSTLAPRSVARRLAQSLNEQRVVRVKRIAASDYLAGAAVSAQEVQTFYTANQRLFQTAEEVDIELLRLPKASTQAAEDFSNLVYEQSDSLSPAATKFGLQIQRVNAIRRQGPSGQVTPEVRQALNHEKLLAAIFSSDSLADKRNTDAFEVEPGVLVSARVAQHRPAAPIPLEAVREQIERQLRERQAQEKATQAAETLKQTLTADAAAASSLGAARSLSRRAGQTTDLPETLLLEIFSAELKALPAVVTVAAEPRSGAAWVAVIESAAIPGLDQVAVKESLGREFQQFEAATAQDQLGRWIALRREAAGVKIYPERLAKSDAQ